MPGENTELQNILDGLDVGHGGVIRYNDFLAAGLMSLDPDNVLEEGVLRAVFNKFDRSKGSITKEDLKEFLVPHLTEEEIGGMFEEAGLKGVSMITYPSFKMLCRTAIAPKAIPEASAATNVQ